MSGCFKSWREYLCLGICEERVFVFIKENCNFLLFSIYFFRTKKVNVGIFKYLQGNFYWLFFNLFVILICFFEIGKLDFMVFNFYRRFLILLMALKDRFCLPWKSFLDVVFEGQFCL